MPFSAGEKKNNKQTHTKKKNLHKKTKNNSVLISLFFLLLNLTHYYLAKSQAYWSDTINKMDNDDRSVVDIASF